MSSNLSRRTFLATLPTAASGMIASGSVHADSGPNASSDFLFSLNTGTLRGYKLSLPEQIDCVSKAGYTGIEPWVADLDKTVKSGGSLRDLGNRCSDAGLSVISAIGFAPWAVNDDATRAKGLEQMKRDMDLVAQLGGTHIAAPPAGFKPSDAPLDLNCAAERYRAVLELGHAMGVIPQLEFWGASACLSRLDQCLYVASRAAHPDACVLSDAFHMYRGGSEPASLRLLGRCGAYSFHMNDYPAHPARDQLKDADRVWPGDGIAPLREILKTFVENHARIWLSVELFNTEYWKRPAAETARTGLEKMRAVVASL